MKKIIICLLFFTMILTSCFTQKQSNNGEKSSKIDKEASESIKDEEEKTNDNNANNTSENKLTESSNEVTQDINTDTINNNSNNTSENKLTESSDEVTQDINTNNNTNLNDMVVKVKEYILNGQGEKPEGKKINWSNSFLEQVNLKEIYDNYLADGGTASDVEWFAKYITSYAPIPINWEEIFKKDLYEAYGEQVVKLELIEGELYQAYVEKEGKEVPYVVVSARTGYFHG